MDERAAFERAIDENPLESTNHLVYADWLDEHGEPEEAVFRRAMGEWHKKRHEKGYTEVPERWTADVADNPGPYSGRMPLPNGVRALNFPTVDEGRRGTWHHSYASMGWPSYRDMEHDFRQAFTHRPTQLSRKYRRNPVRRFTRPD